MDDFNKISPNSINNRGGVSRENYCLSEQTSPTIFTLDVETSPSHLSVQYVPNGSKRATRNQSSGVRSLIASPVIKRSTIESRIAVGIKQNLRKTKDKLFQSQNQINIDTKKQINQLVLEKVFGFTIQNNAAVALDQTSGILAFPAGCVVVCYSAKKNKQFFIHNAVKSPITAIAFSRDGKLLGTGESGKSPKVRIWSVETRMQLFEFSGHSYRVGAIAFSHNSRFVVSVGSQEDTCINVWELNSITKMASSKISSKVIAIAFSETGQFFVTVGVRHVRFWYLDSTRSKTKTTIPLLGRNAILGDFMNNTFTDVGCCCINSGSGSCQMTSSMHSSFTSSSNQSYTYVISQAGQLMQFTEQRYLDKWVELRTPKATCLTVYESYIMVGCSRGIILIFDTVSLSHITTLPMPHYLGISLQNPTDTDTNLSGPDSVRYPDVVAGKYDHVHSRIICFYSDHSMYVWDVRDFRRPLKVVSHLYHSGGVWSVEPTSISKKDEKCILEACSFITCSDDDTIRFWRLNESHLSSIHSKSEKFPSYWENDYSKDLVKIIYADPTLKNLIEADRNIGNVDSLTILYAIQARSKQNNEATVHLKHGIRSIKISPDKQHLAAADREGNIRFYSLINCKEIYSIIAHNGEILSIDYFQSPSAPDLVLFCSASRDRIIHVMDPNQNYKCIQTIDDHSGAIFAARLVETPSDQEIRLISCGMDKSLLFRILQPDESGQTAQFYLNQHLVGKQSQYDMIIAPNNRYAAVVCQDRQVRIYNMVTGKQRKSYRGASSDDGYLLKCAIDPSGTYIGTSGSDKYISILNFTTGEMLSSVSGHSEVAVGLCFLNDLKHLVSVSSDSCVFVWRLPVAMTLTMHRRIQELGCGNNANLNENEIIKSTAPPSTTGTVTPPRISDEMNVESSNLLSNSMMSGDNLSSDQGSAFRFSVSALPSWAQKKLYMQILTELDHVNMMNEFCGGGSHITSVPEVKDGLNDDDTTLQTSDNLLHRLSFIGSEKVIRDDDSDNLEPEDESEWFNPGSKNEPVQSLDLESLIQRISTGEEEDDDEEETQKSAKVFPIRSLSLENEENHQNHCGFVIKTNKKCVNKEEGEEENIMSTSAPSNLATWMDNKTEGSSSDEPLSSGHPLDSDDVQSVCRFRFENCFNTENEFNSNGFRSSLTTKYLSKNSYDHEFLNISKLRNLKSINTVKRCNTKGRQRPSILNFSYKQDPDSSEKTEEKTTEIGSFNQKHINFSTTPMKSNLAKKALSEINVNQTSTSGKKADSVSRKTVPNNQIGKTNFSFGQHTKNRSESRELKTDSIKSEPVKNETAKIRKPSPIRGPTRISINKAISTSSVLNVGRIVDTKPRTSCDTPARQTDNNRSISIKPAIKPTNRARWGEPKRPRDLRKTCPVDLKDIKLANNKRYPKEDNKEIDSQTINTASSVKVDDKSDTQEMKDLYKNEKINQDQISGFEKNLDSGGKSASPLSKGASFDLATRSKEHVIDEIEEILSPKTDHTTENIPSNLEDMFRFLSYQTQNNTNNGNQACAAAINRISVVGNECVMEKPKKSMETPTEPVFDEWIDQICTTHNVEFLTNLVLKILRRFIDNTDWKTESEMEAARRLFPEIERMYLHLQSICEPSLLSDDPNVSSTIIRDIGERIFEEVKRRLSGLQ